MTRRVALSEVAEINPPLAGSIRRARTEDAAPFITMASVSAGGRARYDEQRPVGSALKGYTSFARGDVLLAKITPCFENGKAADLADLPGDIGFGSTEFHVLRAGPDLDARYLFHTVWNPVFRDRAAPFMTGTAGQKRLPADYLKRFKISLPPLHEQQRIAHLLDKANAVREKRQEGVRLMDAFPRALFLEMFGNPNRNERKWEQRSLGDLAVIRRGASPRPIQQFLGGDVPWIKIGDATRAGGLYISHTAEGVTTEGAARSVVLLPGSIVVANSGVSLGFARILGIRGCIHDGWLSVENLDDRIDKLFLVSLINMMTSQLRTTAPSGTQPNLNTAIARNLRIPIPPQEKQRRFVGILEKAMEVTGRLRTASEVAGELASSLINRLIGEAALLKS